MGLPDQFQCKLNVPGLRDHRSLQASRAGGRPVRIEQLSRARAKKGQGWPKVSVIQDVKKLRSKLHVEALRNLRRREVFVHREVKVKEPRTVNAIAAGITDKIRAGAGDARVRTLRARWAKAEGDALGSDLRSRHRQRKAIVVDVAQENSTRIAFEIVVYRIASLNAIRKRELVPTGILYT